MLTVEQIASAESIRLYRLMSPTDIEAQVTMVDVHT